MEKNVFILGLMMAALSSPLLAKSNEFGDCKDQIKKYCKDVNQGDEELRLECLLKNFSILSPRCQKWLTDEHHREEAKDRQANEQKERIEKERKAREKRSG